MSGIAYLVVLLWVVVLFFLGLFGLGQWASRTRPDSPMEHPGFDAHLVSCDRDSPI